MILVVCGPPGAGKTTVALGLNRRLDADGYEFEVVHTDDLASPVYDRLFERVAESPEANWLLDGTFYEAEWQRRIREFPDVYVLLVTADRDTCVRRNHERDGSAASESSSASSDASDGVPERAVKVIYDEFDRPDADFVVDTDVLRVGTAVDLAYERVQEWLAEAETVDRDGSSAAE
ncbi:AAA family ATPase [Halobacterium hubeiense]|uniref:AAA family ATPase n=1 Tax=Halobacterium hubeiense TaxID=1407499 RepID=UPI003C77587B